MLSLDIYHSEETCIQCPPKGEKIKDDICAVCLDEDCKPDVMLLGCGHNFHSHCILKWVQKNFSCPLCRQECQSFVPTNGQTLSPEFTKVWETHYLAKTPEQEVVKENTNENKKTIVQKATTIIEESPTPEVLPESHLQLAEPVVMECPMPLLPLTMAEMPLIAKRDWFYTPHIPAGRSYAPNPSIFMTPSLKITPLAALLFLEASNSIGNRNLRPNVVRVSALEARAAKQAILQNRVSTSLSMGRLTSKRMKLQPLLKPTTQRLISTSATPAFSAKPRHHYKAQTLQRAFEKRAITRVTSKMQAKLSILL